MRLSLRPHRRRSYDLDESGVIRPIVIPKYASVPVFIIKNNLKVAGISRERYLELLGQ